MGPKDVARAMSKTENDTNKRERRLAMLTAAELRVKQEQEDLPTAAESVAAFKKQIAIPWYLVHPECNFMRKWDVITVRAYF